MAVAAELCHGVAIAVRVVPAIDEEHRRVAAILVRVNGHAVLVVAGGAGDRADRPIRTTEARQRVPTPHPERTGIVGQERSGLSRAAKCDRSGSGAGAGSATGTAGAIPVVRPAAGDEGIAAHGMVVAIFRAPGGFCETELRGSFTAHDRQGLDGRTLHHADLGQQPIMAAQAEEDHGVGVMGAGDASGGGQRDRIFCCAVAAKVKGLSKQGSEVLTPQSVLTVLTIAAGGNTIAERAAMWSVTHNAATAVAVMGAENVRLTGASRWIGVGVGVRGAVRRISVRAISR